MPTEADRARAAFAQENGRGYYRQSKAYQPDERTRAVWAQLRAAHHYAMARSILGIEVYA